MDNEFACIRRGTEFSPYHEITDFLICNLTAEYLTECFNVTVNFYDEVSFNPGDIKEKIIFSMVQGPAGIEKLLKLDDNKHLIINPPDSVLSCYRYNLIKKLPGAGIPFPVSLEFSTQLNGNLKVNGLLSKSEKIWIKRIDVHAVSKDDVQSIKFNIDHLHEVLESFKSRGIKKVVLQEHIDGDIVKFYGIRDVNYFHWYYTEKKHLFSFNEKKLKELAFKSANVLGLYIFGGDAVIGKNGNITIIDFNDWPSFAPIRDEASKEIARLIYNRGINYVRKQTSL